MMHLLTVIFFLFFSPVSVSVASDVSCADLVKTNCLSCHSETRICQKIKKGKGKGAWKNTMQSMIRNGANVSKSEQKLLITCLSKPDSGIRNLCPMK